MTVEGQGQELPSTFGRYTLVERLAVGGMAEVFRAKINAAHGFEKVLVIKRILPHLAADKNFVAMFIDEAKLTAQLTHPKIVQVTDFGEVSGMYFIALEFVDGFDALALLRTCAHRRIRLPIHLGIFITQEMLDALDYAHHACDAEGREMKLVHRDISPSNVFISRRGDVKLGDFGIAHAQERESKTQAGTLKGKYGYMSPEQVTGSSLDRRSDIFAVGIVLAEMLMGRRLFTAQNDLDVLLMVRDGNLGRLDKYCRDVPPELDAIVRQSLRTGLADRYQTAAEFREALGDLLFKLGKRVGPQDLGAFCKELFDTSPEALKRLQEQQAKWNAEIAAAAGSRVRSPAPTPTPTPMPIPVPMAMTSPIDDLRAAVLAAPKAPPAAPTHDMLAVAQGMEMLVDAGEGTIPLDPSELQQVGGGKSPSWNPAPRQEADPTIAAALNDILDRPISVVDIDQWGGDSGMGNGPPGLYPRPGTGAGRPGTGAGRPATGSRQAPGSGLHGSPRSNVGRFVSGAPKRPPDASGDTAALSPMRVLADLAVASETGLLRFEQPPHVKEVYLAQGAPQSLNSSVAGERLGEYLVAQGVLTTADLERALGALPQYSGKLGDTLCGLGLMKPLDLFRILSQQVRDRVIDIFSWRAGTFAFFRGVTNPTDAFPLGLDSFEILGTGVLTLPVDFLESKLRSYGDFRPRPATRPRFQPEKFRLGPTPREVLSLLDGARTLRQWLQHFSGPDERLTFLRTLYLLMETDLVQFT